MSALIPATLLFWGFLFLGLSLRYGGSFWLGVVANALAIGCLAGFLHTYKKWWLQ